MALISQASHSDWTIESPASGVTFSAEKGQASSSTRQQAERDLERAKSKKSRRPSVRGDFSRAEARSHSAASKRPCHGILEA